MSNEQPSRRAGGKSGGGAPMGSTISIVIAVVAVVVGFLILRNVTNDSSTASKPNGDNGNSSVTTTMPGDSSTTAPVAVTPTTEPFVTAGATVIVANASGVGGAAGQFSKALGQVGFTMATPTNAAPPEAKITVSKVYYLPGGEAVASSVARSMGGVSATAMPAPAPIKNEKAGLGPATVLVMLGSDLAGKALPALAGDPTSTTTPAVTTTSGG